MERITFNIGTIIDERNLDLEASIREVNPDGTPSARHVITMLQRSSLTPVTHNAFLAPSNSTVLLPNTTYFLTLECINNSCGGSDQDSAVNLWYTFSENEDSEGENDWSIGGVHWAETDGAWERGNSGRLRISLSGWHANRPHIEDNGVRIVSTPTAKPDTYAADDLIELEVRFNKTVQVKSGTTPGFRFQLGSGTAGRRTALYTSGSGTNTLRFQYKVKASDPGNNNGIWIGDSTKTWADTPQGNITSSLGDAILDHDQLGTQSGHKVDPRIDRPVITDIEIISRPVFGVVGYGRDEQIMVRVTFNHDVVVTGPTSMALKFTDGQRSASYISSESSGAQVVYGYTVLASDTDGNGMSIPQHALARRGDPYQGLRGGGTIQKDNSGRVNARLRSDEIGNDFEHRVAGNLYPLGNSSLVDLSLENATLAPTFTKDHREYTAEVASDVEFVTIGATARITDATVEIDPEDANDELAGHQIALEHGSNTITVRVRSADSANTSDYVVVATLPARPAPHGVPVGACHATDRASRVATVPLFHACRRQYPGGVGRCARRSLPGRCQPSPLFGGSAPALPVSRPARRSLALRPTWSLSRPRRPVAPECFSRSRYLLQPLRLLPAGATVAGRGSHPLGDGTFPRRTNKAG